MAYAKIVQYIPFNFSAPNFVKLIKDLDTKAGGTATSAVLLASGAQFIVKGTGFGYNSAGDLTSGHITSVQIKLGSGNTYTLAMSISAFDVDVAKALQSATTGYNPLAALAVNYSATSFVGTAAHPGAEFLATKYADILTGGGTPDFLAGMAGNDTIKGGLGKDMLDGGAGNDKLYGEAGNDFLSGGLGNDTIDGGAGNDYASFRDLIKNAPLGKVSVNLTTQTATGQGTDTLVGIENVVGTVANDTILGSAAANKIIGGSGVDTIDGKAGNDRIWGGLGKDVLTGGTNNDTFVFNEFGTANADRITDYNVTSDTIALTAATFTKLPVGTLKAGNFVAGTKAVDTNDFIIYDKTTGKLFYDDDGKGSHAPQLIAVIEDKPTLAAGEIVIVNANDAYWFA